MGGVLLNERGKLIRGPRDPYASVFGFRTKPPQRERPLLILLATVSFILQYVLAKG